MPDRPDLSGPRDLPVVPTADPPKAPRVRRGRVEIVAAEEVLRILQEARRRDLGGRPSGEG